MNREQDAHLRPALDGTAPFPDDATFTEACPLLSADEQTTVAATVANARPAGLPHPRRPHRRPGPNEHDGLDRMHVHAPANPADAPAFRTRMHRLATALAAETPVLRARPHLPDTYSNADPHPPPLTSHTTSPTNAAASPSQT